jgi:hypothetical protein
MHKLKVPVAIVLLVLLSACQSLGLQTPTSFSERLAAGYASVTTVRDTTTSLLTAGKLTADDGRNIQNQCDTVRGGLDVARTLRANDLAAADAKLQATLTILNALDAYLKAKS